MLTLAVAILVFHAATATTPCKWDATDKREPCALDIKHFEQKIKSSSAMSKMWHCELHDETECKADNTCKYRSDGSCETAHHEMDGPMYTAYSKIIPIRGKGCSSSIMSVVSTACSLQAVPSATSCAAVHKLCKFYEVTTAAPTTAAPGQTTTAPKSEIEWVEDGNKCVKETYMPRARSSSCYFQPTKNFYLEAVCGKTTAEVETMMADYGTLIAECAKDAKIVALAKDKDTNPKGKRAYDAALLDCEAKKLTCPNWKDYRLMGQMEEDCGKKGSTETDCKAMEDCLWADIRDRYSYKTEKKCVLTLAAFETLKKAEMGGSCWFVDDEVAKRECERKLKAQCSGKTAKGGRCFWDVEADDCDECDISKDTCTSSKTEEKCDYAEDPDSAIIEVMFPGDASAKNLGLTANNCQSSLTQDACTKVTEVTEKPTESLSAACMVSSVVAMMVSATAAVLML